ncbi:MAG: DUF262 domain-containing protein [Nitrososphaera sp.]
MEAQKSAFQTPITIREVIENIHRKKYLLPAIQREVVWDFEQIIRLYDSIMREYTIGSFLFWESIKKQPENFSSMSLCDRITQGTAGIIRKQT